MISENFSDFAFIFDLDGTLVNSFPQILKCLEKTSRELALQPINHQITWAFFGQPLNEIVFANGVPIREITKYVEKFRDNLRYEISLKNELFSGVTTLIPKIQQLESKMGIATSKPTDLAKLVCQNSDLSQYPFAIQGSEDIPPKPDPTVIKRVLEELGVSKGIMIGDRVEDVAAGKAAGIYTCAVLQSAHQKQDFLPINPDYIFDSMEELSENLHIILRTVEQ